MAACEKNTARVAIVTGGGRGIGLAIARRLLADGCAVVITGRSPADSYAGALQELAALGPCVYVQADVAQKAGRDATLAAALEHFGRADILVNNAGVAPNVRADLLDMTEESFDRALAINTKGNMFMTQAVARQMLAQPAPAAGNRGVIVNISSCSAVVSSTSRGEYCVSKAGIAMLTQLYADRLAGEGILVHEVRPGVIDTDMTGTVHAKYDALIEQGVFPIARWGKPEDVADVVGALCAPGAFSYTTGDVIDIDGGFHIRRL